MNNLEQSAVASIIAIIAYTGTHYLTESLSGSDTLLLIVKAIIIGAITLLLTFITKSIGGKTTKKKKDGFQPPGLTLVLAAVTLMALSTPLVAASTPDYTYNSQLNTTVDNTGNQSIGFILFTRQPHIPDTNSFNNYTTIAAQQDDVLTWTGTATISVTDPQGNNNFLVPNGQLPLGFTGTYAYSNPGNASQTGTITVAAKDALTVNLDANLGPWSVRPNPASFTLNQEQQLVYFTIDVPKNYPPSTETLRVEIDTNARDENYTTNIVLPEIRTWTATEDTVPNTYTVTGGDTQDLGRIVIRNDGNTNFGITSRVTGPGAGFITTQNNLNVFQNTLNQFDVRARIPATQEEGRYNATLIIEGHGQEYRRTIEVVVTDTEAPVIQNLTFRTDDLARPNRISLRVEDNLDPQNATITYDNNTLTLIEDNNIFTAESMFYEFKTYNFEACATDKAGNRACRNFTKNFNRLDIINKSASINLGSKRHSSFGGTTLLTLTEDPPEPLTLRLSNFAPNIDTTNLTKPLIGENNALFSIRVVDGDGSFKYFQRLNSTVTVVEPGDIQLEVRGDRDIMETTRITFSGVITIDAQEYYPPQEPISYNGVVVDYDLPEDFNIAWGTGGELDCEIRDTGSLDTSFGLCSLRIPAEDLSKDLVVPISLKEKELLENQVNLTITEYEQKLSVRNGIAGVIFALLVIMIGLYVWVMRVRPNLIFMRNW